MKAISISIMIFAAFFMSACDQSAAFAPAAADDSKTTGGLALQSGDPAAFISRKGENDMRLATFGAGCFWGVEAAFQELPGVIETAVGFMGGHKKNPSYKEVCYTGTGHAEVVHLAYNPEKISYEELLNVFWDIHDPTTKNRQGPDIGEQYRSAIFYHSPEQKEIAEASKKAVDESGRFQRPVVTQIAPAGDFWRAEDYHQSYLKKRGVKACR